jgi:hypothetical protein
VFSQVVVDRLLDKCRRTSGRGLSNTDNMRLVAILSTQLLHRLLVTGERPTGEPRSPMTVVDRLLDPDLTALDDHHERTDPWADDASSTERHEVRI